MKNKQSFFFIVLLILTPLCIIGQNTGETGRIISFSDTSFSGVVGSGARAFGMGGAFIAIADDATAASWNPGGLGQLEKPELSVVMRIQNYRNLKPANIDTSVFTGPQDRDGSSTTLDFISFTYPFRMGKLKIVPQISYQRSISFDLATRTNDVVQIETTPDYKQTGTFTENDKFTGGIDTVTFSVGTRILDRVNIGISGNLIMNGFTGRRARTFSAEKTLTSSPGDTISIETISSESLTTEFHGFNFNMGILVDLFRNFKMGIVYKSAASLDLKYKMHISSIHSVDSVEKSKTNFDVDSTTIPLHWPETFGFGFSFRPSDPLTLSIDVTLTRWSKAILKNFTLPDEENPELPVTRDLFFPTLTPIDSPSARRQIDTAQFRSGMEYVIITKNDIFIPLRLGIFTDTQYFKDTTGRKVTFFGITGGAGIKKGRLAVDSAILYEFGNYLKLNNDYAPTFFADLRVYVSAIFNF